MRTGVAGRGALVPATIEIVTRPSPAVLVASHSPRRSATRACHDGAGGSPSYRRPRWSADGQGPCPPPRWGDAPPGDCGTGGGHSRWLCCDGHGGHPPRLGLGAACEHRAETSGPSTASSCEPLAGQHPQDLPAGKQESKGHTMRTHGPSQYWATLRTCCSPRSRPPPKSRTRHGKTWSSSPTRLSGPVWSVARGLDRPGQSGRPLHRDREDVAVPGEHAARSPSTLTILGRSGRRATSSYSIRRTSTTARSRTGA